MINYTLILQAFYPAAQWSLNGQEYSGLEWLDSTPKPTQEELDALWIPTQEADSKAANKATASSLLTGTDWTTIADVADPINSPYLANQAEFITYRNLVRQIAVYPPAGNVVWPVAPQEEWI